MLIYDTRVVERWEKRRCEGQHRQLGRRSFIMQCGEKYMTARRGKDGLRHAGCGSGRACFNMFKNEDMVLQREWGKILMSLTSLLYKTRAVWPPQYAAEEKKPTLKYRSRRKNWKRCRLKYLNYRRGSTADLTRAVRNRR